MVNIAVFAAFAFCSDGVLLANAEFKPVCAIWQLDVWCYGLQKRQEVATMWQRCGKAGGKNGKGVSGSGHVHVATFAVAGGCAKRVCYGMRLFKVLAMPGGAATIELNYHKRRGLSRRRRPRVG